MATWGRSHVCARLAAPLFLYPYSSTCCDENHKLKFPSQAVSVAFCLESAMSVQPPADLLTALRGNLRRIEEEHRDRDLTPAALELKHLLLRRIANIEAAMKSLNQIIQQNPQGQTPCDFDD